MSFQNREQAAGRLVEYLSQYRGLNPVVLGVPRGGVPMARIVADALGGELDVVLVRKICAADNLDYALGAVDETGAVTLTAPGRVPALREHIEAESRRQLDEMRRQRQLYTPSRGPLDVKGRIAIIVDDGIATGATMLAAVRAVRKGQPKRLIAAVPVASTGFLARVRGEVDDVVCLLAPTPLVAIPGFYREFPAVTDDDVIAALARTSAPAIAAVPHGSI